MGVPRQRPATPLLAVLYPYSKWSQCQVWPIVVMWVQMFTRAWKECPSGHCILETVISWCTAPWEPRLCSRNTVSYLRKWLIPLEQQKYRMNLEHLVIPESRTTWGPLCAGQRTQKLAWSGWDLLFEVIGCKEGYKRWKRLVVSW